ncbi:MAG: WD40 repeat domain-containing protein [Kofleriaceae bacterium]
MLGLTNAIAIHDARTGARETGFAVAGTPTRLATAGAGDALVTAAAIEHRVLVLDRRGGALDSFEIAGTTPTIQRRYRNAEHPTHHDNILRDSPSWVEAIALSRDGRYLAIGGSDSTVRLHDRRARGANPKRLAVAWTYRERRHQGGNPDLNPPLAMQFSGDGKRLSVVYRKGDVVTWDVAHGKQLAKLAGTCSAEELVVFANRYEPVTAPPRATTPEDLAECGPATTAAIAPDGSWYASHIDLVRVRTFPAGKSLAMIREVTLPGMLEISRAGQLAMVDLYGRVALWTAATGYRELLPTPISTSALVPVLSRTGRVLTFPLGERLVAWDVAADRELAIAGLVAVSDDGTRTIARTPSALALTVGTITSKLALPGRAIELSRGGTHVLATTETGMIVRDLDRGTEATIAVPHHTHHVLRADGRRLATFGKQQPLQIWDTATGTVLETLEPGIEAVAFFADGRRYLTAASAKHQVTAKIRELGGKRVTELAFTGWLARSTSRPTTASC